jgi:DNA-binding response OmpR family regulator
MRILLVEDDELVADAVVRGLALAGFTIDHAGSAEFARAALRAEHFDLAVIDIGLPGQDGLALLKTLRDAGQLGADDFLMKPFEQAELAVRCRALIRRASQTPSGTVRLGRIAIDLSGHQLTIDAQAVDLTKREWLVLETLVHSLGRVVSKDRLLQALAGWEQELTANAVETHVSRLRAKLGDAAVIRTVRGLGYRLDEPHERAP